MSDKEKRRSTKNHHVLKVVELGLEERVYDEMRKTSFSVEAFCRQLKSEGIDISPQSVRKFIRKTKQTQQILAQQDLRVAREVKKLTMNYTNELQAILKEVQEVKETARADKDLGAYNQLVGRIFQGIELLAKLSGDLKSGSGNVDINIVYNNIQSDIERHSRALKNRMARMTIDVDKIVEEDDEVVADALRK